MRILKVPTLALLAMAAFASAAAAAPVSGHVQDPSGKPISHVLVRQEGGATVTFSDEFGNFRLEADVPSGRRLLLSVPGYLSAIIDPKRAGIPVVLQAEPVVAAPVAEPTAEVPPVDLLNNRFEVRYDMRNLGVSYNPAPATNAVNGSIDSEFGLGYRTRLGEWLGSLDAYRNRAAIWAPGLTANGGTTFAPETVEGTMALGYAMRLGDLEFAPQVVGLYRSVVSSTNGSQLSGTPLDFDQSRRALGLGVEAAQALIPGVIGTAGVTLYPYTSIGLAGQPDAAQLSGMWGGSLKLGVGYQLIPGVRAELGYRFDTWRASNNYAEDSGAWTFGLVSYPAEVRP